MQDGATPEDAPRASFHHGDSHAQALADARDRVARSGVGALTLRELAAGLGVNHRALYRHFPDKQALISLVAAAELRALLVRIDRETSLGLANERAQILMGAYVGHALRNPRLYEMVFSLPLRDDLESDTVVGVEVKRLIKVAATAFHQPGDSSAATRDRAVRAWAMAHGLVLLMLRGALRGGTEKSMQRYIVGAAMAEFLAASDD